MKEGAQTLVGGGDAIPTTSRTMTAILTNVNYFYYPITIPSHFTPSSSEIFYSFDNSIDFLADFVKTRNDSKSD